MHVFGNLGHVVILGPLSLATLFYLLAIGARRDASAFALALLACLATTVGAKLFFSLCGGGHAPHLRMESPSGHESFSAAVYGCIALIVAAGRPRLQQFLIDGAAALLLALIGIGRVAQHAHSPQEVAVGLSIGIAATILFHWLRGAAKPIPLPWRAMALLSPAAIILAFGALLFLRHWTPEDFIEGIGRRLGAHFGLCL